jgi:hypothetical protein
MIDEVVREKGRNFQFEGSSIHYLVGDAIKRNYNLLLASAKLRKKIHFLTEADRIEEVKTAENVELEIMENYY